MPEPDPWDVLVEDAEQYGYDHEEAVVDDLHDPPWNTLQRIGSQLGVYDPHMKRRDLAEALADVGVFAGPTSDSRVFIRKGGESIPLTDERGKHIRENIDEVV